MPKYVIERDIPSVGDVTPEQVIAISQKSCSVLNKPRAENSVAAQLCDTRQDLLRLYCSERRDGTGTRQTGRIPGQQGF